MVILAAQFDLATGRWSIASIDAAGEIDPLVQSAANDLASYTHGTFDEQTSFLRHRVAGALQRGCDRLWGRARKAEMFAIEFGPADADTDSALITRVAKHFCVWMVKPPVVCLQADTDSTLSILAANTESPDQQRITSGLTAMRPLTAQPGLWETACASTRS